MRCSFGRRLRLNLMRRPIRRCRRHEFRDFWPYTPSTRAEVGAYFLAGKLRLGTGLDDFSGARHLGSWIAQVGIADIKGLLYWGVRHAAQMSGPP
jgi:hypothetical protein